MKIKMLRNPARSLGCELCEGETGDVSDDQAKDLIASGVAEIVASKEKKTKAPVTRVATTEPTTPTTGDK